MKQDRTIGIFFHSIFPVPGWGLRGMGLAGWKAHIDWARSLGFNACTTLFLPRWRVAESAWTLPERRRLYHGLLSPRPEFAAGNIAWSQDPLLDTPEAHRNSELLKQAMTYAATMGLRPRMFLPMSLGSPAFAAEHPELLAVCSGDFCAEGQALCPSQPAALDHLLTFWSDTIDAHPEIDSFLLWERDPGGCDCEQCTSNPDSVLVKIKRFCEMIRSKRPNAGLALATWWFETSEISRIAASIPRDVKAVVCPLIHSRLRTDEEYTRHISLWRDAGIEVESWLEVQENPTFLLPACYPSRIERTIRLAQKLGVESFTAASAIYAHTFTLNYHVASQLASDKGLTARQVTDRFLRNAFGAEALSPAMNYVESLEEVWARFYAPSQHAAGFNWPWHMVFAGGLFPAKLMQSPAPADLIEDVNAAVKAATGAVEAAEEMAKTTWQHHSLDTTVLLTSAQLILLRAQFRRAKLPVLDAIRQGNIDAAVQAFKELTNLARQMTETAACAPNTQVLNTHWTQLALLPERLNAVRDHLRELVQTKRIREVFTYGHRTGPVSIDPWPAT